MKWLWKSPLNPVISQVEKTVPVGDGEIIDKLQEEGDPAVLSFCDLSPLQRVGIKFEKTEKQKLPPINEAKISKGGEILCCLGSDELLLLASPEGKMKRDILPPESVDIPRRDGLCWIGVSGERAQDMLSRLCAAELPIAPCLSQTIVAGIGTIVVPDKRTSTPVYHLLADIAYAEYLWRGISHVSTPLHGKPVGWHTWKSLYHQK